MCGVALPISSGGSAAARLVELCATRDDLGRVLAELEEVVSPVELAEDPVFQSCISCFPAATHALVELAYFDADFRSNLSETISHRHQADAIRTDRLIFLKVEDSPTSIESLLKAVDHAEVLGYMVLTPDPGGPVGRSVIPPPPALEDVSSSIPDHVRTLIREHMSVLGQLREVQGVPFVQQDGNLFTCAHAAAWMVHYAAVLRGLAARRPSVQFHRDAALGTIISRQFPSTGLAPWQIATVLEHFGLPVEVVTILELASEGRLAQWYDREAVWDISAALRRVATSNEEHLPTFEACIRELERAAAKCESSDGEQSEPPAGARHPSEKVVAASLLEVTTEFWIKETFTRTACQYLNSGMPAIVLHENHATVLVGYLRRRDMLAARGSRPYEAETDVVAFLASNDQIGPYSLVKVDELVAAFMDPTSTASLLIPLPRGVWMRATDAEELGARIFADSVGQCLNAIEDGTDAYKHATPDRLTQTVDLLTALLAEINSQDGAGRDLSVRSYVVPGTDFKQGFSQRRAKDPIAVVQVRLAALPKFVWVVEVIRRSKRRGEDACVLGQVVLDATDLDLRETNAHIVQVPGAIRVRGSRGAGRWHVSGVTALFASGRYHGGSDWLTSPEATASRWKTTFA